MIRFLRSRPSSFASLEKAIEWCVRSRQTRNKESAQISMPMQLSKRKASAEAGADPSYTWRVNLEHSGDKLALLCFVWLGVPSVGTGWPLCSATVWPLWPL